MWVNRAKRHCLHSIPTMIMWQTQQRRTLGRWQTHRCLAITNMWIQRAISRFHYKTIEMQQRSICTTVPTMTRLRCESIWVSVSAWLVWLPKIYWVIRLWFYDANAKCTIVRREHIWCHSPCCQSSFICINAKGSPLCGKVWAVVCWCVACRWPLMISYRKWRHGPSKCMPECVCASYINVYVKFRFVCLFPLDSVQRSEL